MDDKYDLLREIGLSVHEASINNHMPWGQVVRADDLLALLEQAPRLSGYLDTDGWHFGPDQCQVDTHNALLIGIKPLVRDTAEDIVRALLKYADAEGDGRVEWAELKQRARKLLEEG